MGAESIEALADELEQISRAVDSAIEKERGTEYIRTLRDWILICLESGDEAVLTVSQLRDVVAKFRSRYPTGHTSGPPELNSIRASISTLISMGKIEFAGPIHSKDIMGRRCSAPGYRLAADSEEEK